MKKKNGFTLIELLAVIIILGILMILAVPSVTKYINDSRKDGYIISAKQLITGTRNKVYSGKLDVSEPNVTYYVPSSYIEIENGHKSPYGDLTESYVGISYDGNDYKYYYIGTDSTNTGIPRPIDYDSLDTSDIEIDITSEKILKKIQSTALDETEKVKIYNPDTNTWREIIFAASIIKKSPELYEIEKGIKIFNGPSPNNYVLFNNEAIPWRIIGVYGNQLKILRMNNTRLMRCTSSITEGNSWERSGFRIYLEDTYYNSLSADAKNMIDDGTWYVGYVNPFEAVYDSFTTAKTQTYVGKVGLVSLYEYFLSTYENCHPLKPSQFPDSCVSWVLQSTDYWTISPSSETEYYMLGRVQSSGSVSSANCTATVNYIYPAVFLNSGVQIKTGTGTLEDPYVLEI